jgi:hypothetical protein
MRDSPVMFRSPRIAGDPPALALAPRKASGARAPGMRGLAALVALSVRSFGRGLDGDRVAFAQARLQRLLASSPGTSGCRARSR